MSYVVCRRCKSKVYLGRLCSCDVPAFFVVICTRCSYSDLYSYTDLVEYNSKKCRESCIKTYRFFKITQLPITFMYVERISKKVIELISSLSKT